MKVHNDLKEILFSAFDAGYKHCETDANNDFKEWFKDNQNKILALGKPEPLAKNKQTENKHDKFICPNGCGKNGDGGSCYSCVGK